jgi:hypothetical protein
MSVPPDERSSAESVRTGTVEPARDEASRSMVGTVVAVVFAALCGVYLANPTLGVFELIPDNLPFVGNLDEATATAILISCLGYLGIRLPFLSARGKSEKR